MVIRKIEKVNESKHHQLNKKINVNSSIRHKRRDNPKDSPVFAEMFKLELMKG